MKATENVSHGLSCPYFSDTHFWREGRNEGNLAVASLTFCSRKFGSQENEAPKPLCQSLVVKDVYDGGG